MKNFKIDHREGIKKMQTIEVVVPPGGNIKVVINNKEVQVRLLVEPSKKEHKSKAICHGCGNKGHFRRECPSKKKGKTKKGKKKR